MTLTYSIIALGYHGIAFVQRCYNGMNSIALEQSRAWVLDVLVFFWILIAGCPAAGQRKLFFQDRTTSAMNRIYFT